MMQSMWYTTIWVFFFIYYCALLEYLTVFLSWFQGSGPMIPPTTQYPNAALLSQQAQNLLEEARNENRILEDNVATLKEQVNIFEQEIEQIREQAKIREINLEEEIGYLKEQVLDRCIKSFFCYKN